METISIPITDINIGIRMRPVDHVKVAELSDSIKNIGLLNPITIDMNNTLLCGHHRLQAVKNLGYVEVDCRRFDLNEHKRLLAEIDENLIHHELNYIEKAEHIVRKEDLLSRLGLRATKRGVSKYTDLQTTEKLAQQIGTSKRMYQRIKQVAKINEKAKQILKQNNVISNNLQALIEIERLEFNLQIAVAEKIGRQDYSVPINRDFIEKVVSDVRGVDTLKRQMGVEMVDGKRGLHDYYPTHPKITNLLIDREEFKGNIWECACGSGSMSEVLIRDGGYDVISTDLIDRGYGISGVDFLDDNNIDRFGKIDNIVTNPPFRLALPFILQCKKIARRKVALLGTTQWLDGVERYEKIWTDRDFPLSVIYQISGRISFQKNHIAEVQIGGLISWCWYIWDREHIGRAEIDWILPSRD